MVASGILRDHARALPVDPAARAELPSISRGRTLLIDYFAVVGKWGVPFGDVELRWLKGPEELPDDAIRLDDIEEIPAFIVPELAPLMVRARAHLVLVGPRWPRFLRRLAITIRDGRPWLDFFADRAYRGRRTR